MDDVLVTKTELNAGFLFSHKELENVAELEIKRVLDCIKNKKKLTIYDEKYYYEFHRVSVKSVSPIKVQYNGFIKYKKQLSLEISKINFQLDYHRFQDFNYQDIISYPIDYKSKEVTVRVYKTEEGFYKTNYELYVNIKNKNIIDIIYDYYEKIILYNYFVFGIFPKNCRYPIKIEDKLKNTEEYFFDSKFSNYKNVEYSSYNKTTMSYHQYIEYLEKFSVFYENNRTSMLVFTTTQMRNNIFLEQIIAMILNSLEGLIKTNSTFHETKLKTYNKNIMKEIRAIMRDELTSILETEFLDVKMNQLWGSDKEKINAKIVDLKARLRHSINHIADYTFDEVLEASKLISKPAHKYVSSIELGVKFWKRCKDHRNAFAHPTGGKHKGFDEYYLCYYTCFVLSTYYILVVLHLMGIPDELIDNDAIENEIKRINSFIKNNSKIEE